MLWRYHIFILLVGVPSSRIFSVFTVQANNGNGVNGYPLTEEELIDNIVSGLQQASKRQQQPDNVQVADRGQNETPDTSGNKGEAKFAVNSDSSNNANSQGPGLNLEEQEATNPSGSDAETKPTSGKQNAHAPPPHASPLKQKEDDEEDSRLLSSDDTKFAIFVGAGLAAGFIGIMVAGVCYYKFRRTAKAASDISYPAYGVTGPIKEKIPSPGDRKLAQSAQMYHYQHQKQQMIAMEKANGDMKHDASEDESEEDNLEGDYTVYECPGLAPTGEMEVKNPLFCGEEVPLPGSQAHQEYATPPDPSQGQSQESPSSPSQSHRSQ